MSSSNQRAPFQLDGSHIVITGGSRGLGRAISTAVAQAGATVTIIARTAKQAETTAAELNQQLEQAGMFSPRAYAHPADVGDLGNVDELVDDISARAPITGVVHAAGIQLRKPAVEISPEEFLRVQAVNLHAPYFLSTSIARKQMSEQRVGSHVFIGSLNSSIGLPGISPYVVAKTGLVGAARAFSAEWAAAGIRANVVGPGYFATEMTEDLLANRADEARIMARIPQKKLGDPMDVGNACVYLLSDAASYVTGTLLNVDGGWLGA